MLYNTGLGSALWYCDDAFLRLRLVKGSLLWSRFSDIGSRVYDRLLESNDIEEGSFDWKRLRRDHKIRFSDIEIEDFRFRHNF